MLICYALVCLITSIDELESSHLLWTNDSAEVTHEYLYDVCRAACFGNFPSRSFSFSPF